MKNNTNLKKLGALLLTGALMTGAIVGTNAITAKAAGTEMSKFLLQVPSEITVQTVAESLLNNMKELNIYTTGTMPAGKMIKISAETDNIFNLINSTNQKTIPYKLVWSGSATDGEIAYYSSSEPITIYGSYLNDNNNSGFTVGENHYTHVEKMKIGALAQTTDVDNAGEGDYEDEITFTAEMTAVPEF